MDMEKRKDLTEYEKECAARLKQIWETKKAKEKLTQEYLRAEFGFSTQGAVSHYINGYRRLHTDIKFAFARALGCKVTDFDPKFLDNVILSESEAEWLSLLRSTPVSARENLLAIARNLTLSKNE